MWSDTSPKVPGTYKFKCEETGRTEMLKVYWYNDRLFVDCPDLGPMIVQHYHDGLTNPRWKKL